MFRLPTSRIPRYCVHLIAIFGLLLATARHPAYGQASTAAGTIQGTISDPTGAVIPSATVTITNQQTGASARTTTNASGYYSSGPLIPDVYTVAVSKSGFSSLKASVTVQIGNISNGNFHLTVGSSNQTVEVQASGIRVNTQQSEVQDDITLQQIQNLPINGHNFLDLAQLEPGVQMQDGQNFDPTKAGYASVSFNGVDGRTARISLDGQDISDETVGTTTLNVSTGSVEEFQVGRSDLDLSNSITSSGAVMVSTRSGTNAFHGDGYYDFRDERAGFANGPSGTAYPFQRNAFGGGVGGPILKDKLFFFGDSDRIKQDAFAPVEYGGYFSAFSGGYDQAFRDTYSVARLDWNGPHGMHVFGRLGYEVNLAASTYGLGTARYANRDNTPAYVGGVDFATARTTHTFRIGYLKMHNRIADDSAGTLSVVPGALVAGAGGLFAGPNYLAPQATYQSDQQERYDGSWVIGRHTIRYGVSVNHILGGGYASFFGLGPYIALNGAPVSGGDPSDPGDYAANVVEMGNGQGYFTETPAFGLPAGGQHDWRSGIYGGDSWKVSRNLTVNYGIRWDRDTGRTDSDLAPIPCSANVLFGTAGSPCGSGNLFDSLLPGLGASVRQPDQNFGPQAGFAYDLMGNGKTVIRGGAGIYFENNIFNNVLFDRPPKLATGLYNAEDVFCGPYGTSVPIPGGGSITSFDGTSIATLCSEPVSESGPEFVKLQQYYQQKTAAAGASANPNYLPGLLTNNTIGDPIYWPKYQTPRGVQMNIGVQRQLWGGAVLSVDYLRNVITHIDQDPDVNHVGAARYFNSTAAQNAISATLAQLGASSIDQAIADGATIATFAGNGLDSGNNYLSGGYPAALFGLTPDTGAAFPGANPLWGHMNVFFPAGRSVYNGLQMNYRQQLREGLMPGIATGNLEFSYAFSRFVSTAGPDQFFTAGVYDQDCLTCYIGPSGLDRTHQFSAGVVLQVRKGPMVSFISHLYSSLPTNLSLQTNPYGDPGEIFRTDVWGSGNTGELLPGTEPGAFMRQVKGNSINRLINQYNSQSAGRLTPAGQTLVSSGLFTQGQLEQLGAVTPTLAPAPSNQDNNPWLRTFDMTAGYPIKVKYLGEGGSIEPTISAFNLFNFG
jgi:hypothetical protein